MMIRKLREQDAQAVSDLIITTIRISNVGDYPSDLMEELVKTQTPEDILKRASWTHFYVAEEADAIIGCGAIGPYWGKEDESSLFSIFVHPNCQGKGVGRAIVETLEKDEYALRADRIEVPASITGLPFYQRMGYTFKNGNSKIDDEHLYRLEKRRPEKTNYRIIEGADRIDTDEVVRLLKTTYWANRRSKEQIRKSMEHSSCYGIYLEDEQKLVGFARVITDFATTWYLADVVIDQPYRNRGLGKALVSHIVSLPEYAGLRGLLLTKDAHGLYAKYGFETVDGRAMIKSPDR